MRGRAPGERARAAPRRRLLRCRRKEGRKEGVPLHHQPLPGGAEACRAAAAAADAARAHARSVFHPIQAGLTD